MAIEAQQKVDNGEFKFKKLRKEKDYGDNVGIE
eukprot:CAMPEP_0116899336 /NCGR_PEP_ID=MMETSP0467-20121206/7928_1 /TAXON_ID=283647 /ORGANISM="Mesodinium pulex, Strain SPMC105" /LENGTH=32 /DNA_ID= /DNA_START= /DNA_END= /DNA_ORIENTATION=